MGALALTARSRSSLNDMNSKNKNQFGFTLIEMSIVMVIIGLIIGGVLVGRDLISASAVRAQISQIEKYNSAVNTFRGKYGYLPGDIPDPTAQSYGFLARGTCFGGTPCVANGDGNGIIEGTLSQAAGVNFGIAESLGETSVFWRDLSDAKLIDGGFQTATFMSAYATTPSLIFPAAKIGGGNYVYVYSNGSWNGVIWTSSGVNYFGISASPAFTAWALISAPGLSVAQAYNMDSKIDDGVPQSGKVTAQYINYYSTTFNPAWARGGTNTMGANSGSPNYAPTTTATAGSALTCYDNNGISGTQNYSMGQNGGAGINCALSFQFQ